jgi:phage terminase Nu1 subunit (DNA packaging protein)
LLDLGQPWTQTDFGSLVGITQPAVSDLLKRGVLSPGQAASTWLLAYCAHLRETAAGRAGGVDGGLDLVQERAALAREQRVRLELLNATARGKYAPIETLADVLARASAAIVSMLDQLDSRIAQSAPDLPEATRLAVLNTIAAARNECVRTTASLDLGEPVTTDDDTSEATVQILDADA